MASSRTHRPGTARGVRDCEREQAKGFMLLLDAPRGDTSLHRCDTTPAWVWIPYAIGAVDAQAARAASIIITILGDA